MNKQIENDKKEDLQFPSLTGTDKSSIIDNGLGSANISPKKLYISAYSGEIYYIPEDEEKNLDEGQIPLLQKPKENCNKCYGRGFTDKNIITGFYSICKCMRNRIDYNKLKERVPMKEPVKVNT